MIVLLSILLLLSALTAPEAKYEGDPNDLKVVQLSSIRTTSFDPMKFPFILFNDAQGDVTRRFKEYAKIKLPKSKRKPRQAISLSYDLSFSQTFEWSAKGKKGGLLPGLTGGKGRKAWKVQLGWTPEGNITVKTALAKQNRGGRKSAMKTENADWKPWPSINRVRLIVQMNGKKERDGRILVEVNGQRIAISEDAVFHWKGRGRAKYVLREGRYLGPSPTSREQKVFRYLLTRNVKVAEVKLVEQASEDWWLEDNDPPALPPPALPPPTLPPPTLPPPSQPSPSQPSPSPGPSGPTPVVPPSTDPKTITINWTKGELSHNAVSPRWFDARENKLYLCSRDVLRFEWSDEPGAGMGIYGFYSLEEYQTCAKDNLNYMKNTRPSGAFATKPNRGGWRYYAHFEGADDGHCKYTCKDGKGITGDCTQRLAVSWERKC
jgi:hypothetical protein